MVAAHYVLMPEIQAYDVALYGGTPERFRISGGSATP